MRDTITSGNTTKVLDFIYDAQGRPFALNYSLNGANPTTYYYILNLQGDVVQLRTADGTVAATCTYDAWGKVISYSGTMAGTNPLRYRGYYCDTETGFYYLQSRYYDPELHRFINADSLASTGQGFLGTNMFAYCLNCPINYVDEAGSTAAIATEDDFQMATEGQSKGLFVGALVITAVVTGIHQTLEMQERLARNLEEKLRRISVAQEASESEKDNDEDSDDDSPTRIRVGRQRNGKGKTGKGTPRSNQAQNEQTDAISKKLRLTPKQRRRLHDKISKKGYSFSEILDIARDLFEK